MKASRESMAWTLAFEHHEDHAPTHGYGDARSGDGGIREELAAEVKGADRPSGGLDSERFRPTPRTCGRFRGNLGLL
jgi:hypothetical protein